jgi:hypothetical protein
MIVSFFILPFQSEHTHTPEIMRLEIMGKDIAGLVTLAQAAGIRSYNVPNKDRKDDLLGAIKRVKAALPAGVDIVPHWSIKAQHLPRDKDGKQTLR